ncbi:MAG: hypothetical protein KJI71_02900 [Patescibacteria group bacterium]|nr:hypothetical protein [Patescibacteria group bacterium]
MKKVLGFTLIELLVIISILIVLTALSIPAFRLFYKESGLINSAEKTVKILVLAQNRTLASEGDSQWGVYFSTSSSPHQYTLFKGTDYANRDTSFDEVYKISERTEIYQINLAGGKTEVVFDRITGATSQSGTISLRLKDDILKQKQITIEQSGQTTSAPKATPTDDDRIKDSRHVHFDYTRQITTSTESIKLIFTYNNSTATQNIIIADNLKSGQIYWEDEVDAGGETQKLIVKTHILNNPYTQFSIHRDKRYNTRALKVEISGDTSGNMISYDDNGQTQNGTSIYVSDPEWQ